MRLGRGGGLVHFKGVVSQRFWGVVSRTRSRRREACGDEAHDDPRRVVMLDDVVDGGRAGPLKPGFGPYLAWVGLFAACEQKTTTVNPPADRKESNTTIVNPPSQKKETNTTVVNPPGGSSTTTKEEKTDINVNTSPNP